jgi:hypothetical protein
MNTVTGTVRSSILLLTAMFIAVSIANGADRYDAALARPAGSAADASATWIAPDTGLTGIKAGMRLDVLAGDGYYSELLGNAGGPHRARADAQQCSILDHWSDGDRQPRRRAIGFECGIPCRRSRPYDLGNATLDASCSTKVITTCTGVDGRRWPKITPAQYSINWCRLWKAQRVLLLVDHS